MLSPESDVDMNLSPSCLQLTPRLTCSSIVDKHDCAGSRIELETEIDYYFGSVCSRLRFTLQKHRPNSAMNQHYRFILERDSTAENNKVLQELLRHNKEKIEDLLADTDAGEIPLDPKLIKRLRKQADHPSCVFLTSRHRTWSIGLDDRLLLLGTGTTLMPLGFAKKITVLDSIEV